MESFGTTIQLKLSQKCRNRFVHIHVHLDIAGTLQTSKLLKGNVRLAKLAVCHLWQQNCGRGTRCTQCMHNRLSKTLTRSAEQQYLLSRK